MENKTKENRLYFLLTLLCIGILCLVIILRAGNFEKSKQKLLEEGYVPIELPAFNIDPFAKEEKAETFETDDKKLKLTFSNSWVTSNAEQMVEAMDGLEFLGKETETIFVAYKLKDVQTFPCFFIIGKTNISVNDFFQNTFGINESFFEEKEEELEFKEGIEKIELIEKKENSIVLAIKSEDQKGINVNSLVKIIVLNDISYIITLNSFNPNFEKDKAEFLEILDSVLFSE